MKQLASWLGAGALAFGLAGAASAAGPGDMPMEHGGTAAMHSGMDMHAEMIGDHAMPARVTKVDHKNGLVHVTSMGMRLVVHFPPATVEDLKPGDKIKLHLGYSKE